MTDQGFPEPTSGGSDSSDRLSRNSSSRSDGSASGGSAFGAGLGTGSSSAAPPKRSSRRRSGSAGDGEGAEEDRPRRRRGSRGGRSRSKPDQADDSASRDSEDTGESRSDRPKRRRRGGRGRRRKTSDEGESSSDAVQPEEGQERSEAASSKKKAKKRSKKKSSKARSSKAEPAGGSEDSDRSGSRSSKKNSKRGGKTGTPKKDAKGDAKSSKKKRRRTRSRSSKPDDGDDGGRQASKAKKPSLTAAEKAAAAEKACVLRILVNGSDPEEQRVVVVGEDDRVLDMLMTSDSQKTLVNDIYRGRVVNLEPAIGAAFIDFGQGRNGFLHISDVMPTYGEKAFKLENLLTANIDQDEHPDDVDVDHDDEGHDHEDHDDGGHDDEGHDDEGHDDEAEGDEAGDASDSTSEGDQAPIDARAKARARRKAEKNAPKASREPARREVRRRAHRKEPITDVLKVGDQVVVQITKDAIGDKGPTLTTYISIPGRYLVLMPSMARTGVSKKIPDEKERRRLKRVLSGMNCPDAMGVIVRTAGVGRRKTDLQRDLDYLMEVWETFSKRLKRGRGPSALYQESDLAIRTMRDLFDERTKTVMVDDLELYEEMQAFAEQLMPEQVHRIERFEGERPIFHHYGIEQDFERIFSRKLDLPSGGSVVFDQAEALVAIDINSGRTRTKGHDFEKVALKTNMEAVPEIARQIRLRDLGGILVIDFIDMMRSSSNRQVEKALRTEMAGDRARSKMGRIGQFGLLELTRQRLGPGAHKKVFSACYRCRGTGRLRTVESRAQAILRRLGSAVTLKGFTTIEVRAHPAVVQYLEDQLTDWTRALEHRSEKTLTFVEVPEQAEDSVLRYLRADGREVRPGGRRKR